MNKQNPSNLVNIITDGEIKDFIKYTSYFHARIINEIMEVGHVPQRWNTIIPVHTTHKPEELRPIYTFSWDEKLCNPPPKILMLVKYVLRREQIYSKRAIGVQKKALM